MQFFKTFLKIFISKKNLKRQKTENQKNYEKYKQVEKTFTWMKLGRGTNTKHITTMT